MRHPSIYRFLMIGLLSTMGLADLMTMAFSYRQSFLESEELQDAQLVQYARALSMLSAFPDNNQPHKPGQIITVPIQMPPEDWQGDPAGVKGHKYEGKLFFKIYRDDQNNKTLLAHSVSTPDFHKFPLREGFRTLTTAGQDWRTFSLYLPEKNIWIVTAQRGDIRQEMGDIIAFQGILPTLFSLPVVFFLINWLVRRGLRPVNQMAGEMARRQATDLYPVTIENPVRELDPLITSTNQLLARLSEAFQRERRFVGDAAHELRTPLAGLGLHLQIAENRTGAERDQAITRALQGHRRLARLFEQLLILARTTPDSYQSHFQRVNLNKLCQTAIADNIHPILNKQQQITLEGDKDIWILGDEAGLLIMINNLIRNAMLYTPEGGTIRLQLDNAENTVLDISDSGPGIPIEQRERVFDRFYRIGSDRHASGVEGSGLGLSIVKHVVDLHHADITLADADLGGLNVKIRFTEAI
ncbi:ATP-binding protein [Parendozoicomonas haliclonae]|uniref:histidine kinase n=1 Tax=Parendozoicomonas haliclonae TaxID=1960125 RepID=A0A1X7AQZ4_9GAMM|nr:ATP-binding protein [Parendozoicomonas haliclonae]SMA50510.1 Sensor protein QseC [Parendozoicomonas haliclonae]